MKLLNTVVEDDAGNVWEGVVVDKEVQIGEFTTVVLQNNTAHKYAFGTVIMFEEISND